MKVFSEEQVSLFSVGDKVTVVTKNEFTEKYQTGKGTIIKVTPKTITIRQYKQKTKGWTIKVGGKTQLLKGWDVSPLDHVKDLETIETYNINGIEFEGNLDSGLLKVSFDNKLADEVYYYGVKTNFIGECEKWYRYHAEDVLNKKAI